MESQDSKDKFIHSVNNCQDPNFNKENLVEGQANIPDRNEDVELNITECSPSSEHRLVDGAFQDATEASSSFSEPMGPDKGAILSDAESPEFEDRTMGSVFDGFDDPFPLRKRKLTDHWRRFIRPLMWRCKWIELQLKEFKSQTLNHDRELAEYGRKKQVEFENLTFEAFHTRSQPFSFQIQRKRVLKRKKRKRVEETADMSTYMSHHNLFSYYGSKKSVAGNSPMDGGCGNLDIKAIHDNGDSGVNDGWLSSVVLRDGGDSLEQILWKIEVAKSQVCNLRTRAHKVKISEFNMEDLFMHQSAVSSHGEVTSFVDVIESISQHQVGVLCENAEEDILIHNQAAQEELRSYGSCINLQEDKRQTLTEKPETISPALTSGSGQHLPTKLETISPGSAAEGNLPTNTSKAKVPTKKRKSGNKK